MSASHRKRDSREALVRWLRDRSSGGRTSHSGTFDCRFLILDCTPFPRSSIESRQSKSPKILAGNILQCFNVAGARHGLNRIRLQLAIYSCLHSGSLPENTAGDQPQILGPKTALKKFRKNYMSHEALRQEASCRFAIPRRVPLAQFRNGRWRRAPKHGGCRLYVF